MSMAKGAQHFQVTSREAIMPDMLEVHPISKSIPPGIATVGKDPAISCTKAIKKCQGKRHF